MKLLFLIHRLPCPPDRGSKLRAAIELAHLAQRHDVWCAGFLDVSRSQQQTPEIRKSLAETRSTCRALYAVPLCRPIAAARGMSNLLTGRTATEGYFASEKLNRQVMGWSNEVGFDAVLAFSSSMAPLALRVPADRHVLDLVDLDSRKWAECAQTASWPMSWVYRTEASRLARRESQWIRAFDASVLVNQREADLLSNESLHDRVHVIETGAALETKASAVDSEALEEKSLALPEDPVVGFIGAMDYGPNIDAACWFAEAIWPKVQARRPDANWLVVGRSPTRAVRKLDNGRNVRVTGTVPAMEPYLEQMRVNVAPLRLARGVQTKVLTAMAAGRPCVVTSCVAEGIGAQPDNEILVADSPTNFADAVIELLSNRRRAEALARAGRDFVLRRFRPSEGSEQLEKLLCGDPV